MEKILCDHCNELNDINDHGAHNINLKFNCGCSYVINYICWSCWDKHLGNLNGIDNLLSGEKDRVISIYKDKYDIDLKINECVECRRDSLLNKIL